MGVPQSSDMPKKTAKKTAQTPDFEKSLDELEKLVERMEQCELTLEESLKSFERGVELTRRCQKALDEAQQKVDQLLEKDGEIQVAPLEDDISESGRSSQA
jgi:exodeoxyribonuclease VII small subunit